ncbi:MAG: sulfatase-like hydrolase/transferase [Bryobacterales bacterium]|nr:sulfatase-like hydrolase/transferase [Bryobacterales bacterium]
MPRLLLALALASWGLSAAPPNILFVYTDDQAAWALGLSGHPHASTPNMDKLFRRGAYLPNSFTVTPVCSPSRVSLIASRYGSELGVTDWINPRREPFLGLPDGVLTWPQLLHDAGYRTGLVGKWHLGLLDGQHPTKRGYEHFMGFRGGGTTPSDPVLEKDGKQRQFEGLTADILTQEALDYLDDVAGAGPFLLSLHYRAPHTRWLPVAPSDWAPFDGLNPIIPNPEFPYLDVERVRRMTREYLASTKSVDRNIGRLLAKLDELGLADTTLIVCSSDHGYNMGHSGVWHKGNGHYVLTRNPPATANIPDGQRPNMWDRSIRVPTAVVWPGQVPEGSVVEGTVSNLDWLPTLAAAAGVEIPAGTVVRGRNILPLLRGEAVAWDDELYGEYSTHHQSRTHMRMLRTLRWKLVRDFLNPERDELYDLAADPDETTNLIRQPRARRIVDRMGSRLLARMAQVGDRLASQ